eukprot:Em0003g39a
MEGTGLATRSQPRLQQRGQLQPSQQFSLLENSGLFIFDVGMQTVPKEMSSRVNHSIRLGPAFVQQREHRRQDREQRAGEPANTPDMVGQNRLEDAQQGKRGPYASGLGRWPQHLKSLAIERHSCRYPGWLNIPMQTNNGQPARGVWGPGVLSTKQLRHLKLNFDAFAKLSDGELVAGT